MCSSFHAHSETHSGKSLDISLVNTSCDPLIDVDSPFDDTLIKIEYRRPADTDVIIPPSLEKPIEH